VGIRFKTNGKTGSIRLVKNIRFQYKKIFIFQPQNSIKMRLKEIGIRFARVIR